MTQEEIIEMAVQAGIAKEIAEVNIHIMEAFAKLVEKHHREKDREGALAYMRMLHDSFSLASKDKP